MTAAIDHDEKTHAAIKTKEIDPNDVVPDQKLKHETPNKVKEILKDPKVEAKKAANDANKTSNANKTKSDPPLSKLKADS